MTFFCCLSISPQPQVSIVSLKSFMFVIVISKYLTFSIYCFWSINQCHPFYKILSKFLSSKTLNRKDFKIVSFFHLCIYSPTEHSHTYIIYAACFCALQNLFNILKCLLCHIAVTSTWKYVISLFHFFFFILNLEINL